MPAEFESNHKFSKRGADENVARLKEEAEDDATWYLLSLYADGEATPEQAAQVEALLRSDPAYARDLAFLRASASAVQSTPEVEPPAALHDAILDSTTRRPKAANRLIAAWLDLRRSLSAHPMRYAVPMGALAAATIVGIALWSHRGPVPGIGVSKTPKLASIFPSSPRIAPPKMSTSPVVPPADHTIHPRGPVNHEETPPVNVETPPYLVMNTDKGKSSTSDLPAIDPKKREKVARNTSLGGKHSPHFPVRQTPMVADTHPDGLVLIPASTSTSYANREDENRHMAMAPVADNSSDTDLIKNQPDVQPSDKTSVSTPSVKSNPVVAANTPSTSGRIITAHLPPETREMLTSADLRRRREATMLHYDPETVKSIERREVTVSVFKAGW